MPQYVQKLNKKAPTRFTNKVAMGVTTTRPSAARKMPPLNPPISTALPFFIYSNLHWSNQILIISKNKLIVNGLGGQV
ncbi:MAG: hypothetical protein ACFWUH_10290 [Limosilactobacillus fermentum]